MTQEVWQDAELCWKIRAATSAIFEPLDAIGQNIENSIDEHTARKPKPVIVYVYCNSKWLIIEDTIGMTPQEFHEYIKFGASRKVAELGQYGHGGKDASLVIAGWYYLISRKGNSYIAYQLRSQRETYKVQFKPIWIENEFPKKTDGTLIAIPNKADFTIDEIEAYLIKNFYKGLVDKTVEIYIGEEWGKKTRLLVPQIPSTCIRKEIKIQLEKRQIEKFCKELPLKSYPEISGIYLVPLEKEKTLEESGWSMFCHGKFLSSVDHSRRGIGYISLDFIVETDQLTTKKSLRFDARSLFAKHILPKLNEWLSQNLGEEDTEDGSDIFEEVSKLLGPLWGGSTKQEPKSPRKPAHKSKVRKRLIIYKEKVASEGGKTPGYGVIQQINNPSQPLIIGLLPPDSLFFNRGIPDGKFILTLPRSIQKALIYSRAALFMPKANQARSGRLTSEELSTFNRDALKSQEYWINAIRRDYKSESDIIYLGDKRLTISRDQVNERVGG